MAALIFKNLAEARGKLKERHEVIGIALKEAGNPEAPDFSKAESLKGDDAGERLSEFQRLADEADAWGKEIDTHWLPLEESIRGHQARDARLNEVGIEGAKSVAGAGGSPAQPGDGVGRKPYGMIDRLYDDEGFKSWHGGSLVGQSNWNASPQADIDQTGYDAMFEGQVKALMDRASGWTPEVTRVPGMVIYDPQQQPAFVDLLPRYQTSQTSVLYMREDPLVNRAGFISEGEAAPQAVLGLAEEREEVRQLAVYIPVTQLQLEDEAMARSYIDRRLVFEVRQKLSNNCLNGSGANNQLQGLLNVSGINSLDASALEEDGVVGVNNFDAIMRACTKAEVSSFRACTNVVMHPETWQAVLLQKDGDGNYMYGMPGMSMQREKYLWGLPIMTTTEIAAGTSLMGDFAMSVGMFERKGLGVRISEDVNDGFIRFVLAVRVDLRAAMVTMLPQAFSKITNLKTLSD